MVRSPEGEVSLDLTGRKPGRALMSCRSADCLKKAIKSHRFEREFNCEIPQEVYDLMEKGDERKWRMTRLFPCSASAAGRESSAADMTQRRRR